MRSSGFDDAQGRHRGAFLALALWAVAGAAPAAADVAWLCQPGVAENPCRDTLESTIYSAWTKRGARNRVRAVATLRDGRRRSLSRVLRACA